jgi:hypothetical protein
MVFIVPIIIWYDGIMYEKSTSLLDNLFEEITAKQLIRQFTERLESIC